jgi:beta-N-acetylhexosaminidase
MDELAAAVLLPSFPGTRPPDWIRRFLAAGGGGITLFSYNGPDYGAVNAALRAERPDLLIAIDEEGGDVTRLESDKGSSFPGNAALGAIDDVAATESVAEAIGARLAAAGVNWNFAPVADVNVPGNPVIGVRSFGSDVALVARHTAAYVRGLQRAGVAACTKHYPGHGSTEEDSHLELPTVTGDVEAGLEPFRAAVAAGTKSVMTAHIRVPAYGDLPATINAPLLGLLRADFDGVIVSDALEMKGLSGAVGVEQAAVLALEAGCDALCVGHDLHDEAVASIAAAIATNVREERLQEAAFRVRRLSEWALRSVRGSSDVAQTPDVARRAVTIVGDVRVRDGARIVELFPVANIAAGEHTHTLNGATFVREGEPVPDADVYIVRDAHRHAWMREAADRPDAVIVEVGLPEWHPCRARGYIATRGRSRVSLDAAREVLGL